MDYNKHVCVEFISAATNIKIKCHPSQVKTIENLDFNHIGKTDSEQYIYIRVDFLPENVRKEAFLEICEILETAGFIVRKVIEGTPQT